MASAPPGYVGPTGLSRDSVSTPTDLAVMVFLDAQGKFSHAAGANRVHSWLARFGARVLARARGL